VLGLCGSVQDISEVLTTMPDKPRVIQFGLGPIGGAVARQVVERSSLELVGAVDIDPTKVGQDVGQVIGLDRPLGFVVSGSLAQVLKNTQADVVLHTTSSYFDLFKPQIIEILEAGLDIVSTAEELSFPWLANPEEAAEIDAVAKRVCKTVLGTGVNPGFVMDSLPLNLTAICLKVNHIDVTRVINASLRRGPFQAKIGSGLSEKQFNQRMAAGRMGHVGLPESMHMVFDTVGMKLARYDDSVEPVLAERVVKTDHFEVQPGQVRGLKQVARGYTDEGEFMTLTFLAALDAGDDGDTIRITGVPNLEIKLKGTNGDIATVAITVNAIRRVLEASPGLVTMRDLPIVTVW
jgi:4-hydroxy-tetrahydrodipicolinate reductase